jgi:hypothetical protein
VEYPFHRSVIFSFTALFHGASRKGAKDAKFGEIGKYFSLRSWRLGAKNFVEVVLLNILSEAPCHRQRKLCIAWEIL